MTGIILATVLCHVVLPLGTINVTVTAKYLHTLPGGAQYTYSKLYVATPGEGNITAEGWPWHVTATSNGRQVANCSYEPALLISGFESGDLRDWE